MSKETTKAKILANLAGQGSMIDISGQLPAILDEIIDLIPEGGGGSEPLVVEGTYDEMEKTFTATDGTTAEQALAAFNSGGLILSFEGPAGEIILVRAYSAVDAAGALSFLTAWCDAASGVITNTYVGWVAN